MKVRGVTVKDAVTLTCSYLNKLQHQATGTNHRCCVYKPRQINSPLPALQDSSELKAYHSTVGAVRQKQRDSITSCIISARTADGLISGL